MPTAERSRRSEEEVDLLHDWGLAHVAVSQTEGAVLAGHVTALEGHFDFRLQAYDAQVRGSFH